MRKQFVNRPLILCYCQTARLQKLPQMLGLLGCDLPLAGDQRKGEAGAFARTPPPPPPTPLQAFSWSCGPEGWMGV